ncbi:rhodanese-like domain-containing protein [bacterium]|nr:rhodanese-like domain-containing protein [bacterium]
MKTSTFFLLAAAILIAASLGFYFSMVNDEKAEKQTKNSELVNRIESHQSRSPVRLLTLNEAHALYSSKKAIFLDARTVREYEYGHIAGAMSAFYGDVKKNPQVLALDRNTLVVAYCNSETCPMAEVLATRLDELGFKRVYVFSGGMKEWLAANYPVLKAEILQ